jgi:hypothetical protein
MPDSPNWRSNDAEDVIASQRVGAKRHPMTGSAKQSILQHEEKLDCFVASLLAMTADVRPRGAMRPRLGT